MGITRKTKSIDTLLSEFENKSGAISATALIKSLHSKLNKTTVYRVLDKLEDDGVLHSFLDKNGQKCYAQCKGCTKSAHIDGHPHFQCFECEKIDCLPLDVYIPVIPKREIKTYQILIQGKCEACLAKK